MESVEAFQNDLTRLGSGNSFTRSINETEKELQQIYQYRANPLFICDLDVFAIYKGKYKHSARSRYKIYLSPMFHRNATNSDKLRDRLRGPRQLFYLYLSVKYVPLIVIQIIMHSWLMHLNKLNNLRLNNHLDPQEVSEYIDYYESAIERIRKIENLLGNPFSSRLEFSLVILCSTLMLIIYNLIVTSHINSINPFDAANIRFMLDPETEMRRVDMQIERQIHKFLINRDESKIVLAQLRLIPQIRPATFNAKHYVQAYNRFWFLMINLSFAWLFHWLFLGGMLYLTIRDRCRTLMSGLAGVCNIWTLFNWRDWIALFDFTMGQILSNTLWVTYLIMMVFTLLCQLRLVVGLRESLLACLVMIRNENIRQRNYRQLSSNNSGGDLASYHCKISSIPNLVKLKETASWSASKKACSEVKTIAILLQTYVKLALVVEEIRRNALYLKRGTECLVIVGASIALPICMIVHVGNLTKILTQLSTLMSNYLVANIILTIGARVYFLLCKQERIAFSILAELSVYRHYHKQMNLAEADRILFDSVALKWLRYVHNQNLSDRRNTASIFGVIINYGTVLSLNFAFLTLASVITSFQSIEAG